ncbi:DUF3810 domain-containing protein [Flaviaesturariibacter amylovorans]|uniref:DUF3810 domain-containing protein n=1 Tax=Flaviaesturariibacter amylovorans TaxID=1084520 RepID=A0ABP8GPP6_9BACT
MQKHPLRDPWLLLLVGLVLAFKIFAESPARVEQMYSNGIYPPFSRALRAVLSPLPFSLGDLLYFAAGALIAWGLFRLFRSAWRRQLRSRLGWPLLVRGLKGGLIVYLVFQAFWGLNYSREGIARQLDLLPARADTARLEALAELLQARLCTWGDRVDSLRRLRLEHNDSLFAGTIASYRNTESRFPFLRYRNPCLKPSLYSGVGHLFGFTGYYNPFSGEAQVNTAVPVFLRPFVACHEVAHQLGYGKENEANFVGFLAARHSTDPEFRYSAYYEMYLYTLRELAAADPLKAVALRRTAHPQVRKDYRAYLAYLHAHRNRMEPLVSRVYDQYLKMNQQAHGIETYDEVVLWLLAYMRKYGEAAI